MTKYKILISLLFVVLASCAPKLHDSLTSQISMPDIGIPVSENGKFILLETPEGWNSFSQTEPIVLRVKNVSDEALEFQSDFGAQMFIFRDNKWVELEDTISDILMDSVVLEPNHNNDPFNTEALPLFPKLENYKGDVQVRIIVVGQVVSNEMQQRTAFIDVTLYATGDAVY